MVTRQKEMEIVKKLQGTKSPTDVLAVMESIRQMIVCENLLYEDMLERCLHTEDITSRMDAVYPIFEKDLAQLLENQSKNEQIIILTEMIILLH